MAASNLPILTLSRTLSGAVAQYQPVQASGAPATAAGNVLGFAQTAGASGGTVPLVCLGTTIAVASAAIAVGAALEVAATVTQVATRSAGVTIGRALTAATQAGDLIEVALIPN